MSYSSDIGIPFGKYQLLRKLAAGGMAEIFLAETGIGDIAPARLVIKRILPHLTDDASFLEMFLDEARVAARLSHPGIIQILDLGRIEDSLFIAMEYVRGEDLASILKATTERGKPMPPAMAATILARVADALDYAHSERDFEGRSMRVVHRDVTPQNIMVGFDGSVKLLDFGIAKVHGQLSRTKPGTVKGKYFYMSPEQCRGKELDGRSDLFSVGILLYEMTTGVRPFAQESEFETLKMIVNTDPPPPSVHVTSYPEALGRIVERALWKDREGRYPTGSELKNALESYLADTGQLGADIASYVRDLFPDRAYGDPEDAALGRKLPSGSGPVVRVPSGSKLPVQKEPTPAHLLPFDSDSTSTTEALPMRTPMLAAEEPSISIVSDPFEFAQVNAQLQPIEPVGAPPAEMSKTLPTEGQEAMAIVSEIEAALEHSEVSALAQHGYDDDDEEGTRARKRQARWFGNLLAAVAVGLGLGSALAFVLRPSARPPERTEEVREPPPAVASASPLKKTRVSEGPAARKERGSLRPDAKKERDPKLKTVKKVAKKSRKPEKR